MLEIISFSTVLQSMGLQKVGHSLAMEQQQIKIWDFFFLRAVIYIMNILLCWNVSGDSFP